jgi:cytochrome c553
MAGPLKMLALLVLGIALVVGLAMAAIYFRSESKLNARTSVPAESIAIPSDVASIQHGQHIAGAIAVCTQCHAPNLGGAVIVDDASARVVAPNLTRGGVGGTLSDADLARAIRYGLDPSGRPLWMMPSHAYSQLSDADLGALIAYLRSLPPIATTLPPSEIRPLGRLLLASGQASVLAPGGAVPSSARQAAPEVDATPAYGEYLATIAGCDRCHGPGLGGGTVPGSTERAPNLTPARLGDWSEADFVRAMRTGHAPDGSEIDGSMPWQYYAQMSDLELRAIWEYLGVIPARAAAPLPRTGYV